MPPGPDVLEISLFGPGYGEAIVIHLGGYHWLTVDSCVEPTSREPAALHYLRSMNIDVAEHVKLIVATHWHDDHIRGISKLVQECPSANVVISSALLQKEFLKLAALYRGALVMKSSGIDEFGELFSILAGRRSKFTKVGAPIHALVDRLLFQATLEIDTRAFNANVYALSPSDAEILLAKMQFAAVAPDEQSERNRLPTPTQNHASTVLWCEVGEHILLLGADLEDLKDAERGWSAILDKSQVISGKQASVFKVSHHGAASGHSLRVWTDLLKSQPHAILTPYNRGARPLPSPSDASRITGLTNHSYITSSPTQRRHKWRDTVVRQEVSQATRQIYDVHSTWGHVRLRCPIGVQPSNWQVELFGSASALSRYSQLGTET